MCRDKRRALIVGIDDYEIKPLHGCVKDAKKMHEMLSANYDHSPNFHTMLLTSSTKPEETITKDVLYDQIVRLFAQPADIALFYFAGHGMVNALGGHLVTQDNRTSGKYHKGVGMTHLLELAREALNQKRIDEIIIFLDCCNSGEFGTASGIDKTSAVLGEGMSILTASRGDEAAMEIDSADGGGILTSLLYDALNGGAADLYGRVTLPAIYSYIDQALDAWDQRPMLKLHVSNLSAIRNCKPTINFGILRKLPEYFPEPTFAYFLDKTYEITEEGHKPENVAIFNEFKQLQIAGLLHLPDVKEEKYMNSLYWAAIREEPGCKLTALGQYYRKLAAEKRL